jgi:hypothetical protein
MLANVTWPIVRFVDVVPLPAADRVPAPKLVMGNSVCDVSSSARNASI